MNIEADLPTPELIAKQPAPSTPSVHAPHPSTPHAAAALEASNSSAEVIEPDGRHARWETHRTRKRRQLIKAARKAIVLHGSDASMDHIAATAGTSKSVIYRYFGDREGLQMALSHMVVDETYWSLRRAVDSASTPREALFAMVNVYLEMLERSPSVYRFVTRGGTADPLVARFTLVAADLLSGPLKPFLGNSPDAAHAQLSAQGWATGAIGFIHGTGDWWLTQAPEIRVSRDQLTKQIATWLWNGFVSEIPTTQPKPTTSPKDQ